MLDTPTGRRPKPSRPPLRIVDVLRAVAVLCFGGFILYKAYVLYVTPQRLGSSIGYQAWLGWGLLTVIYGAFRLYQVLAVNFRKNRFDDVE